MARIDQYRLQGAYANQAGTITYVTGGYFSRDRNRSDIVKTPEHQAWLADKKSTWLPPKPYVATITTWGYKSALVINPVSGQSWAGNVDFYGPADRSYGMPDTTGITATTILKIREKIKDQDINFGAAIAEGQQTIDMIARSAKAVASALKKLKHGNFKGAANDLKKEYTRDLKKRMKRPRRRHNPPLPLSEAEKLLADRWLELQFGWQPMLDDISGGAEMLAKDATANPTRHRFKADAAVWKPWKPVTFAAVDNGNPVFITHTDYNQGRKGVRYVVYYGITNKVAVQAARNGLLDIGATAWEVVPFSFVVDWIYPVGPLLETISATAGKEFLSGTRTEFIVWKGKRVGRVIRSTPSGFVDTTVGHASFTDMARTVLTSFPVPELPRIKNPFSVTHALDALAILRQGFERFYH